MARRKPPTPRPVPAARRSPVILRWALLALAAVGLCAMPSRRTHQD